MSAPGGHSEPRRAIALSYDGTSAPRVAATGTDALAEEIIALARQHGVPLTENAELAGLLARLEAGEEIPELLYVCIAQILAFAYRLRGRVPPGSRGEEPDVADGETFDADPGRLISLEGPGSG